MEFEMRIVSPGPTERPKLLSRCRLNSAQSRRHRRSKGARERRFYNEMISSSSLSVMLGQDGARRLSTDSRLCYDHPSGNMRLEVPRNVTACSTHHKCQTNS